MFGNEKEEDDEMRVSDVKEDDLKTIEMKGVEKGEQENATVEDEVDDEHKGIATSGKCQDEADGKEQVAKNAEMGEGVVFEMEEETCGELKVHGEEKNEFEVIVMKQEN